MKKTKIALYIDSTAADQTIIALEIDGLRVEKKSSLGPMKSQVVLPLVEEILEEHKLRSEDLTEIFVNPGPGSFTGVRVGISIANALSVLLNISINEKPPGTIIQPHYEATIFDK